MARKDYSEDVMIQAPAAELLAQSLAPNPAPISRCCRSCWPGCWTASAPSSIAPRSSTSSL
jgi:hypothetical protein